MEIMLLSSFSSIHIHNEMQSMKIKALSGIEIGTI